MGISNGWGYSAALAGINLFLWIVTIIKYRTAYLKNPAFSSRYIFVGFILILHIIMNIFLTICVPIRNEGISRCSIIG